MEERLALKAQMKLLREQFIDALGYKGKTLTHYRDFSLTVLAGLGVFYGEIFGMGPHSGDSTFDLKVSIGCFAVAAFCVFLAANRFLVLGSAVMVPGVLVFWHYVVTGDRQARAYYLLHLAAGVLVLIFGGLTKLLWQRLRSRRTR